MVTTLPVFKGYTIDFTLKEFKKIHTNNEVEFVEFTSKKGVKLLSEFISTITKD